MGFVVQTLYCYLAPNPPNMPPTLDVEHSADIDHEGREWHSSLLVGAMARFRVCIRVCCILKQATMAQPTSAKMLGPAACVGGKKERIKGALDGTH